MLAKLSGEFIRGQRLGKGMSQAELARSANVSRSLLSRLEQGGARAVQTDTLDRLFEALGCQPPFGSSQGDARKQARLEQQRKVEQNRSRHLRLAVELASDEHKAVGRVAKARERVALWRRNKSCSPMYIERWSEVLELPPRRLAKAMASFGDWEDALFQNSPWSWAWT